MKIPFIHDYSLKIIKFQDSIPAAIKGEMAEKMEDETNESHFCILDQSDLGGDKFDPRSSQPCICLYM